MDTDKVLEQIKKDIINSTTMHPLDEKRVARTFYEFVKKGEWYGMDEVQVVIDRLGTGFSPSVKERIYHIAEVILMLIDRS